MLNSSSGSEDVDSQDCVVEGNKMSAWLWLTLLQWLLASMVFLLFILVWPALIPTLSCSLIFGNKQCQSPERHLIPPPDLVLSGLLFLQLFFLLPPPLAVKRCSLLYIWLLSNCSHWRNFTKPPQNYASVSMEMGCNSNSELPGKASNKLPFQKKMRIFIWFPHKSVSDCVLYPL